MEPYGLAYGLGQALVQLPQAYQQGVLAKEQEAARSQQQQAQQQQMAYQGLQMQGLRREVEGKQLMDDYSQTPTANDPTLSYEQKMAKRHEGRADYLMAQGRSDLADIDMKQAMEFKSAHKTKQVGEIASALAVGNNDKATDLAMKNGLGATFRKSEIDGMVTVVDATGQESQVPLNIAVAAVSGNSEAIGKAIQFSDSLESKAEMAQRALDSKMDIAQFNAEQRALVQRYKIQNGAGKTTAQWRNYENLLAAGVPKDKALATAFGTDKVAIGEAARAPFRTWNAEIKALQNEVNAANSNTYGPNAGARLQKAQAALADRIKTGPTATSRTPASAPAPTATPAVPNNWTSSDLMGTPVFNRSGVTTPFPTRQQPQVATPPTSGSGKIVIRMINGQRPQE